MKKYIRTYDKVISQDICNELIAKFEASQDQQTRTEYENHRYFTEININQHKDWEGMVNGLYATLKPYIERYKNDCKIQFNQWPDKFGFEQIRF